MKLLEGKTALIFGVGNSRSIAWGIAQAFHAQGAKIGMSYAGEIMEKRVRPLAEEIGVTFVEPCDVTKDEEIAAVTEKAKAEYGKIDILVHSIAYAGREELLNPFVTIGRQAFLTTMDISVYSFVTLANHFSAITNPGGAFLTMTYYGAVKVSPSYNVMGVAKAALEASTRYMAYDLGPRGIRVNAISAGPIRTLAAAGVSGFKQMYKQFIDVAPLHQNVTQEDVGNAAVYLCSDMAARVTGEVHYVDSGYNIMGTPKSIEE
ncbi:MAG TPA: enoyl-ACP reductase [Anaerolineales bacterium]|nr:enoyl-ACP reductase [Anaerolineales bacterium]